MSRRKELRNLTIGLQDGFSGTGAVDDAAIANSDTTLMVDSLDLVDDLTIVPVGARFTTAGIPIVRTVTAANNSAQWNVTVGASSGNFTLTLNGETTGSLLYSATAATIQTALEGLASVEVGDVVVTGTDASDFVVTLAGNLANISGQTMSVSDVDLMGGAGEAITNLQDGTTTWQLTFTPSLVTGSLPANSDVITFLGQRVAMKIGDGNIEWTENSAPVFDLDRGILDGVRAGDEVPMDVSTAFVFNWLRASSNQPITVYEALNRIGNAAGWVSTSLDPCEPYCVDIFIIDRPPCGGEQAEVTYLPRFYKTSLNPSVESAQVSISGQCNATRPVITREDASEYL